jgi:hypothetical protein
MVVLRLFMIMLLASALPVAADTGTDEHCQACHADVATDFAGNTHHAALAESHAGKRCGACHGDGSRHALTMNAAHIHNPRTSDSQAAIEPCIACHGKAPHPWDKGRSDREYQCNQCHTVHGEADD